MSSGMPVIHPSYIGHVTVRETHANNAVLDVISDLCEDWQSVFFPICRAELPGKVNLRLLVR